MAQLPDFVERELKSDAERYARQYDFAFTPHQGQQHPDSIMSGDRAEDAFDAFQRALRNSDLGAGLQIRCLQVYQARFGIQPQPNLRNYLIGHYGRYPTKLHQPGDAAG